MNITRRHMLAGAAALGALPFAAQAQGAYYADAAGKKHKATAFSWEKTDRADELKKAAKL